MKEMLVASTIAVLLIVGLGAGYYINQSLGGISTTGSTKTTTTGATGATGAIVESPINSSSACAPRVSWENTSAMNTLRSNVMRQPTYMEMAQSRGAYYDAGYGCSLVNGTQFTVIFGYQDMAHPFQICGNRTQYPTFFVDAKIYLLSTGYDLSKTSYSTRYYDSGNMTITCPTTTTTS